MNKLLLGVPILLSLTLVACAESQEDKVCAPVEKSIVELWKNGKALTAEADALKKEGDEITANFSKSVAAGTLGEDTERLKEIVARTQEITNQLENSLPQIQGVPDRYAAAGCSQERFNRFRASHPEIWPNG